MTFDVGGTVFLERLSTLLRWVYRLGVDAERGECSAAQLITCSVIPSELDDSVYLLMIVKRHRSVF